jgi:hypothetical protein
MNFFHHYRLSGHWEAKLETSPITSPQQLCSREESVESETNIDGEFFASPNQGEEFVQGEISHIGSLHRHRRGK